MVECNTEFAVLSQGRWQDASQKLWLLTVLIAHPIFGATGKYFRGYKIRMS